MTKKEVSGWLKCALFILILLLWILSAAILAEVTVIRDDLSRIVLVTEGTDIGDFYIDVFFPIIFPVLVTVSCFVFVIGCIGWCGAFTESQLLLGWFFFSVLISFCVELSAGIWRVVNRELRHDAVDLTTLKSNIDRYGTESETNVWFKSAWGIIHQKFSCCGVNSYNDWLVSDIEVLHTCCPLDYTNRECAIYLQQINGCGTPLLNHLSTSREMAALPYLMGATAVLQIILLILALKLWLSFCLGMAPPESAQHLANTSPHEVKHPLLPIRHPEGYYVARVQGVGDQLYIEQQPPTMKIIPVIQPSEQQKSAGCKECHASNCSRSANSAFSNSRKHHRETELQHSSVGNSRCNNCHCSSATESSSKYEHRSQFSRHSGTQCYVTDCSVCPAIRGGDVTRLSAVIADHRTTGVGASNDEEKRRLSCRSGDATSQILSDTTFADTQDGFSVSLRSETR